MNYKLLLNLIKNLVIQPKTEAVRITSEAKGFWQIIKEIVIPFTIAIILAQFVGNVAFGRYYFSQLPDFFAKVTLPLIMTLLVSALLYTLLMNEILQYYLLPHKMTRTFYLICNAFTPVLTMEFFSGLVPQLRPLLVLFGAYSYYVLWLLLKSEYSAIDNKKLNRAAVIIIISMNLLHWTIVACTRILL